jgi:hypothetical protein
LLAVATAVIVAGTTASQATTSNVDLSMTESVVAGVRSAQPGQELPFYPDTPACEPGTLVPGHTTQAAILVTAPSTPSTMTVKACASNELASVDPVLRNNCKTLSVPIG